MSRHTFIAEVVRVREDLAKECVTNAEVTLEGIWNRHITQEDDSLVDLVIEVVNQSCSVNRPDDTIQLDSFCISTYADALRFLESKGKVVLILNKGRNVVGRWV